MALRPGSAPGALWWGFHPRGPRALASVDAARAGTPADHVRRSAAAARRLAASSARGSTAPTRAHSHSYMHAPTRMWTRTRRRRSAAAPLRSDCCMDAAPSELWRRFGDVAPAPLGRHSGVFAARGSGAAAAPLGRVVGVAPAAWRCSDAARALPGLPSFTPPPPVRGRAPPQMRLRLRVSLAPRPIRCARVARGLERPALRRDLQGLARCVAQPAPARGPPLYMARRGEGRFWSSVGSRQSRNGGMARWMAISRTRFDHGTEQREVASG